MTEPILGWIDARARVLTRYAGQANESAVRMREHAARNGHDLAATETEAVGLERYAATCELAACKPSLPDTRVHAGHKSAITALRVAAGGDQ